jgi:tetratricopeptide (TPR) repeat protein
MSSALKPPLSALVERLADEMGAGWEEGHFHLTEEFLRRHPDLLHQPDAAIELLAEELTLRDEYRQPITLAELEARFPQWRAQVQALWDCQQVLGPRFLPPEFPEVGQRLGEFALIAELGRGSHGRVYRAKQSPLADRAVVLKVSPLAGAEHLSLARLQHSNIVPLYSAHEFPDRRLRGLCMPDFGGCTLADLQRRLAVPPLGRDLLRATGSPSDAPADVTCWVGAALADALQYAHDRGILHLDLKPSNVLIAADGVPMLLDFHLARAPLEAGEVAPTWLGGTPEYMPPEQVAAMAAVRANAPIRTPVDGRADVYSLGQTLREFLAATGRPASPGLADILDRCTAPRAEDRYPTAAALAADLRRHLADLPLAGVRNRSWAERWKKWRRRRPAALPRAFVLAGIGIGLVAGVAHVGRLTGRAKAALADGRTHLANREPAEAAEAIRTAEQWLEGLPFQSALRGEIRETARAAEREVARDELHAFADRVRFLSVAEPLTDAQLRKLHSEVRAVWDEREKLTAVFGRTDDLFDLGIIHTDLHVRTAADRPAAVGEALAVLDELERRFGSTPVLDLERRRLGQPPTSTGPARARSAWDHVWAGRSHLAAGRPAAAVPEFEAALRLDPASLWANYYHGVALLRQKKPADAAAAFTACVALAPRAAWCRFNRALAYHQLDRPDAALADLTAAVGIDPVLWPAFWERAAIRLKQKAFPESLADLGRAKAAGAPAAETLYRTAVVRLAANDRAAAAAELRQCLALDPRHADAARLLGQFEKKE